MLSRFTDFLLGVSGIKRKRSKYRCERRGENFCEYDEAVRERQRKNALNPFERLIKQEMGELGVWNRLSKAPPFEGGRVVFPFTTSYRKRARYRKNKPLRG